MKKIAALIMLVVAGASSAQAAEIFNKDGNKVDLYGKLKAQHTWTKNNNFDGTYARLGFKGQTQVNDNLVGYGQFETEFNASQPEGSQPPSKTRLAFAGVKVGNSVSFDYGRNYGIAYDVGSYTDTLSEFGGDSFESPDRFMTYRANGLATVRTSNGFGMVDGLKVGAQYQGANETGAVAKQNGNGYGFSLGYDDIAGSGVSVISTYAKSDLTAAQTKLNGEKHAEIWGFGTKYDANSIYLATMYAESRGMMPVNDQKGDQIGYAGKVKHFEAMAAYTFDNGLRPNIGFVHTLQTKDHKVSKEYTKYIQIGTDYSFNKNITADVGYKINLKAETKQDNAVTAGLTYQF